jgi:UDP-N-acetylglucosamine 2-epimerase
MAHFAATLLPAENLYQEGVPYERVFVTGNTVIDVVQWAAEQPFELSRLPIHPAVFTRSGTRLILVTAHRRESFGAPLENIGHALRQIVCPVHLNPNIQEEPVRRILGGVRNVHLLPPREYLPLVHLMKRSFMVLTDSGGIQEGSLGFGIPVLVLREVTELPEGIPAGTARLSGTDTARIVSLVQKLLDDLADYEAMAHTFNPYGDGLASDRIAERSSPTDLFTLADATMEPHEGLTQVAFS